MVGAFTIPEPHPARPHRLAAKTPRTRTPAGLSIYPAFSLSNERNVLLSAPRGVNREVSRASQPPRRLSHRRVSRPRDVHGLARAGSTTPINRRYRGTRVSTDPRRSADTWRLIRAGGPDNGERDGGDDEEPPRQRWQTRTRPRRRVSVVLARREG